MIQYIEGDIFDSPAQVIVNTVNTVGVMGKGIALSFKQRYPDMFKRYREVCEKNQLTIGKLMLIYEKDHWILLFPTKENWRNPSQLIYIEKGLMKFVNTYAEKNIHSIAFPCLGCGNGALSWEEVKPLMEKYLKPLPIDVFIYLGKNPDTTPEHKKSKEMISWLKENAKDLSFGGIKDDIQHITSLLPYELIIDEEKYEVYYRDELAFKHMETKEIIEIPEEQFFKIWDSIRRKGVFSSENLPLEKTLLLYLLCDLRYISKIKILDNKSGIMQNGYQINEGSGRVYSFKEN